jgi:hypothetical protein
LFGSRIEAKIQGCDILETEASERAGEKRAHTEREGGRVS